jgi:hypothetical protein
MNMNIEFSMMFDTHTIGDDNIRELISRARGIYLRALCEMPPSKVA